jgi:hypothetical protein
MTQKSFLFAIGLLTAVFLTGITACKSTVALRDEGILPVRTIPDPLPQWALGILPLEKDLLYATGTSRQFSTLAQARDDAYLNAIAYLSRYYGIFVSDQAREAQALFDLSSHALDPVIVSQMITERLSSTLISQLEVREYAAEIYLDALKKQSYLSFVLTCIPKKKIAEVLEGVAADTGDELLRQAREKQDQALYEQAEKAGAFFGNNLRSVFD